MGGSGFRRAFGRTAIVGVLLGSAATGSLAAQTTTAVQQEPQDGGPRRPLVGVTPPEPRADGRLPYAIARLDGTVAVDGRLDEPEWAVATVVPLPWEVDPGANTPAPVATECRLTHDEESLYLGCTAEDPRPDRIRAYVVDRDGISGHDRIVLTLDPFNDQRRAFQFGVNALGVQSDAIFAQQGAGSMGGPPVDASWDAIWSSAGTITEHGYVIEAAIPFSSLRFPGDPDATWGAYLTRWWPRSSNVEVRSAPWNRDDSCVLCQANVVTGIQGEAPGVNVQLTPTFTSSRTESRAGATAPLVAGPTNTDFGLDAQWGVTSDLTLNLTANPDFSQVEADVAQLEVNNRFALFFPEKRPFFLEGADFFGTLVQAVFTRSIVDPTGGAKMTGKIGSSALGLLVAQDQAGSLIIPGSEASSTASLDQRVVTALSRFRRDVGGTSTVGALFTAREGSTYHNRVGGVDAFVRPLASVTLQAQVLRSQTEYPAAVADVHDQPAGPFSGNAGRFQAQWSTNAWTVAADANRFDGGFRADAGFVTQTGVEGGSVTVNRHWFGGSDRWFSQLRLEGGTWRTRDFDGNQLNGGVWMGFFYSGPGQTSIGVWPNLFMKEHWAGTTYEGMHNVFFNVRTAPSGAWTVGLNGNVGDAIDFANDRRAFETRLSPVVDVRLGRNLTAGVQHTYQTLESAGGRTLTAHVGQLRTVYNFSTRSFLRAIVQYRRTDRDPARWTSPVDRRSESLFAQLLYAYKLNPQSVLFLGYAQDGAGTVDADRTLTPMTLRGRTLFVKLGYAWRP